MQISETWSLPHIHEKYPKIENRFLYSSKSEGSLNIRESVVMDNDVIYMDEIEMPERVYIGNKKKIRLLEPSGGRRNNADSPKKEHKRREAPKEEKTGKDTTGEKYKDYPETEEETIQKKPSSHKSKPTKSKSSKSNHSRRSASIDPVENTPPPPRRNEDVSNLANPIRYVRGLFTIRQLQAAGVVFTVIITSLVLLIYFLSPASTPTSENENSDDTQKQSFNNAGSQSDVGSESPDGSNPDVSQGGKIYGSPSDIENSGEDRPMLTNMKSPYDGKQYYQKIIERCRVHPFADVRDYLLLRNRSESGMFLRYVEDVHREALFFWTKFGLVNANITTWVEVDVDRIFTNDGYKIETILQDLSATLSEENIAAFKWIGLEKKNHYFQKAFFTQCWIRLLRSYNKYHLGISGFYGICQFSDTFYDFLDSVDIPARRPPSFPLGMSNCHPDRIREHGYYNFEDAYYEFEGTRFEDYKGVIDDGLFEEYRENPNANFESEYYSWEYEFNDENIQNTK